MPKNICTFCKIREAGATTQHSRTPPGHWYICYSTNHILERLSHGSLYGHKKIRFRGRYECQRQMNALAWSCRGFITDAHPILFEIGDILNTNYHELNTNYSKKKDVTITFIMPMGKHCECFSSFLQMPWLFFMSSAFPSALLQLPFYLLKFPTLFYLRLEG